MNWVDATNHFCRGALDRSYPLTVAGDGSLSLGSPTDLSSAFGSQGVWLNRRSLIYLSSPRGGNPVRNYVDGLFVTESKSYYYFRLRLP